MKRQKKGRAPRPSQDREINPYVASAAEHAPRPRMGRVGAGAVMVFIASVIGPLTIAAGGMLAWRLQVQSGLLHALAVLLGTVLVVGAYWLTGGRRFEPISDGLRGATRLFAVVYVVVLLLLLVTFAREDRIGFHFLQENVVGLMRNLAEASLALVAARHLAQTRSRFAAKTGGWLAAAMLGAIVAVPLLTRTTRDDMFFTVPAPYAYMVLPIGIALWVGKLAVFGMLCWALTRRTSAASTTTAST